MSEIEVSVIIPTFRRPQVLERTLESFAALEFPPEKYEVIVVDDGSNDETAETVRAAQGKIKNLTYIEQPNSGVATARNLGAKRAQGDVLIFNDDDIIVPPDLIEIHLKHLAEFGDCVINGHWEFPPEMTDYFENTAFGRFRVSTEVWVKEENDKKRIGGNVYEPLTVSACNCGIRRESFWKIGGYDEQFPFAGAEDHEFCLRAVKAGFRLIYDYDLKLLHNDHRINIEQFGERQRRNAITRVLLATKYPELEGKHPMIVENSYRKSGEPLKKSVKKLLKSFFTTAPVSAVILGGTKFLEKYWKESSLLPRLYNVNCGIYIFRGVREGLQKYGEPGAGISEPVKGASQSA